MQTQYNGWYVDANDQLTEEQVDAIECELPSMTVDLCDEDGELEGDVNEQEIIDFVKTVVPDCEVHIDYDNYSS
jgi:hypothetical protein